MDLSSLKDLAQAPSLVEDWAPPSPERLAGPNLLVYAFDQSLENTGLVVIERWEGKPMKVFRSETLRAPKSPAGNTGFEHDYRRALALEDAVAERLDLLSVYPAAFLVVHETPPVGSKKLPGAGTSSRMAGQAVRSAVHRHGLDEHVLMLNAQQAKKHICGNAKAEKREAHQALVRYVAPWLSDYERVTNEHERDALLLALLAMRQRRG